MANVFILKPSNGREIIIFTSAVKNFLSYLPFFGLDLNVFETKRKKQIEFNVQGPHEGQSGMQTPSNRFAVCQILSHV